MKVGAGRTLGLGIATLAVSLGFAAGAEAAKLPKFAVTNISSPPSTGEPGDTFTALGVVENKGKKSGKATVRTSLRPDNVPENGPIPLGMTETAKVKKGDSDGVRRPVGDPRVHRGRHLLHGRLRDARRGLGLPRSRRSDHGDQRSRSARLPAWRPHAGRRALPADRQRRLRRLALRDRARLHAFHERLQRGNEDHDDRDGDSGPERVLDGLPGHSGFGRDGQRSRRRLLRAGGCDARVPRSGHAADETRDRSGR